MSEHIKGALLAIIAAIVGWLWNEMQKLIKNNDVLTIRVDHLERDTITHTHALGWILVTAAVIHCLPRF